MEKFMDWVFDKAIIYVLLGCMTVPFLLIPVAILSRDRPTFQLKKDDWSCTEEKMVPTTILLPVGKMLVPSIIMRKECYQWSHK